MHNYLKCLNIDEADKKYFIGWNNHVLDKRCARNFDKTEFYFGNTVAEYCRKHNISSLWTNINNEKKEFQYPWDSELH